MPTATIALLMLLACLQGCGQMGALYHPGEAPRPGAVVNSNQNSGPAPLSTSDAEASESAR